MGLKTNYTPELTAREKEIEIAICEKGIFKIYKLSEKFCVSESTIRTHMKNIFNKRTVHSVPELMFKYYQKHNAQNAF